MQHYDRNHRPRRVDPRLAPGGRPRRALREKSAEASPVDRTGVRLLIACVVLVVAVPVGIHFALRGPKERVVVKKDDGGWESAEDHLLEIEQGIAPVPAIPPIAEPSVTNGAVAAAPASLTPAEAHEPPAPERTVAAATVPAPDKVFKKKRQSREEVKAAKAKKTDGENRYFTLELSGSLGGAQLDPEDSQTWARVSYFVRQEARRPHFLVYPDGSVPVSAPVNGKSAPGRPAGEEVEPGGDPEEPAYRLVITASASQGQGVTFMRQRLASTFRCQVGCRVYRRVGDSWKILASVSTQESINPQTLDATPAAYLRRVYDATIQKLVGQLADQPPFKAAPQAQRG